MKKLAFVLALTLGCSSGSGVLRIAADIGRAICGAAGCNCAPADARARGPAPVAFDIYPDGGVRAVYR